MSIAPQPLLLILGAVLLLMSLVLSGVKEIGISFKIDMSEVRVLSWHKFVVGLVGVITMVTGVISFEKEGVTVSVTQPIIISSPVEANLKVKVIDFDEKPVADIQITVQKAPTPSVNPNVVPETAPSHGVDPNPNPIVGVTNLQGTTDFQILPGHDYQIYSNPKSYPKRLSGSPQFSNRFSVPPLTNNVFLFTFQFIK